MAEREPDEQERYYGKLRPTYPGTDRVITRGDRFLAMSIAGWGDRPPVTVERVVSLVSFQGGRWVVSVKGALPYYVPDYGHVIEYLGPERSTIRRRVSAATGGRPNWLPPVAAPVAAGTAPPVPGPCRLLRSQGRP